MLKKLKFWENDIISFYCHPDLEDIIPKPRPASKSMPQWFKDLPTHFTPEPTSDNPDQFEAMTAKKCIPLLDGMSLGFTIPLCGDVFIRTNHNNSKFFVQNTPGCMIPLVEYHSKEQIGGKEAVKQNQHDAIKFVNHWVVKTAPGWSTLFLPPLNHFDSPFTCLAALVDTDTYPKEVNFPAIWHQTDAKIKIPAGTPLVTAIPIKRSAFKKQPNIRKMSRKEFEKIERISKAQKTREHVYTNELRVKK